jgi:uncharacterized Zn finger protein (UPF0148 family)
MTPENPGKILQQELVCEICGELFNTVESLKHHREAESQVKKQALAYKNIHSLSEKLETD